MSLGSLPAPFIAIFSIDGDDSFEGGLRGIFCRTWTQEEYGHNIYQSGDNDHKIDDAEDMNASSLLSCNLGKPCSGENTA